LWEKIGYSFLLCKFEKEAPKKGKNCQSFETTQNEKKKNQKNIGSDITNQRHIAFLSLDNENC
jgi:hypothetical protein